MDDARCAECGMTGPPREYHSMAMCELFKASHNSTSARALIRGVVAYGMEAQRLGISLERAMSDITAVRTGPGDPNA